MNICSPDGFIKNGSSGVVKQAYNQIVRLLTGLALLCIELEYVMNSSVIDKQDLIAGECHEFMQVFI
jgi:hypothetical protein